MSEPAPAAPVQIRREDGRIRLTGELRFETVPALLESSTGWFENREDVIIDLSAIARSDSAGVALLLEWLRRARARACAVRYVEPPRQMRAIIDFCALQDILPIA